MPTGEQLAVATPVQGARTPSVLPRRFAWALLVGWVVVVLGVVVVGERTSSWSHLESDVAGERVDAVRVDGGLQGHGFATVDIHWRKGPFAYTTSVIERRPAHQRIPAATREAASAVVGGDVEEQLRGEQPELRITHGSDYHGVTTDLLGFRVSGWLTAPFFLLWLSTFALLLLSRTTWRATRWAWFWFFGLPPVGPIAYLVLGGPTGIAGKPSEGSTRLTGGWAFLIVVLLGGAFTADR